MGYPDDAKMPQKGAPEKVMGEFDKTAVPTPESDATLRANMKRRVSDELRKDDATAESLTNAMEEVMADRYKTFSDEQKHQFREQSYVMSEKLLELKAEHGAEGAVKKLHEVIDRYGQEPEGVSLGAIAIGGATGLAAATLLGIGDWSSFSGIMKNVGMIVVGLVAGGVVGSYVGGSGHDPGRQTTPANTAKPNETQR